MRFFKYVPPSQPIGLRLLQAPSHRRVWLFGGGTRYSGDTDFSPLTAPPSAPRPVLDFPTAYPFFVIMNLLGYVNVGMTGPLLMSKVRNFSAMLVLIALSGLISYGLRFELERG